MRLTLLLAGLIALACAGLVGFGSASVDADAAAARPDTVRVTLVDFDIQMPDTLMAGPHVFHVINEGSVPHGFELERDGEDFELEDPVAPGATARFEADLGAGLYRAYCPVGNHTEDHGMERAVVVTGRL
jgi:hypothetical protein